MKLLKYLWAWLLHLLWALVMVPFALWESVTLWAWEFREARPRWEHSTESEEIGPSELPRLRKDNDSVAS